MDISGLSPNEVNDLGNRFEREGKLEEALKYYLLAASNGCNIAHLNIGSVYNQMGNPSKAEEHYLIAYENGSNKAMFNLGLFYKQQRKFDLAEKYYKLAIENGSKYALNNLAALYQDQGNTEMALEYYKKAIKSGLRESITNVEIMLRNRTLLYLLLMILCSESPSRILVDKLRELDEYDEISSLKLKMNSVKEDTLCQKCLTIGSTILNENNLDVCLLCYAQFC